MADLVLNINMDERCLECKKGGATPCGLCLSCVTKAMDPKRQMKSAMGRAMQDKLRRQFAASVSSTEGK
jgi:hypothetical protein